MQAGLARFKGRIVRIPLRTVDVTDGSMTEAHPNEVPRTCDYSVITPSFAEMLITEVIDRW